MTSVGPLLRRRGWPTLFSLAVLSGCSLAGPGGAPAPAGSGDGDEAGYLDGSTDGAGAPAGVEELVLGVELEREDGDPEAGPAGSDRTDRDAPVGEPLALDHEIRSQFGALFLDPAAPVPPEVTARVAEYVELFHRGRARENFGRWLAREGRYRDFILEELRAGGLPEELLYLAMLESGFNPTAVSRAGAVGLWQFMRATGRESGLRIDDWVDERRDPVAATRAAIGHLKVLHRELGDWALAAAAYNAGLGRVRRARNGSRAGYFDLVAAGKLPRETRSYVPLILAAGHVARHRERYGFGAIVPEPPHAFETVDVPGRTRLSAVARLTGVPAAELAALNAHLVRGAAPPGKRQTLRVPVGTPTGTLPERLASLALEERILPEYRDTFVTVRSGDSWWRIARAHGRTVAALRALNPRLGEVIHPGQRVLVERRLVTDAELASAPVAPATRAPAPAAEPARRATPPAPRPAADSLHRVRAGETMSEIAVRIGVPLAELAAWNEMEAPRPLRTGEVLRLVPPPPVRHRVASGETMSGLALRYGMTLDELVRLNGLPAARPLRIGETLVVAAQGEAEPGSGSAGPSASAAPAPAETPGVEPVRHRVARGETLTSIARRYHVRIEELVAWNDLGSARPLREGEILMVRAHTSGS